MTKECLGTDCEWMVRDDPAADDYDPRGYCRLHHIYIDAGMRCPGLAAPGEERRRVNANSAPDRKCPFCSDATVAHVDTEIDEMDYVRITFCCASCDRSFVEIYEYDHTEDEDGNDVDFWRALPRKPRR